MASLTQWHEFEQTLEIVKDGEADTENRLVVPEAESRGWVKEVKTIKMYKLPLK